jgi:hypothetical protein
MCGMRCSTLRQEEFGNNFVASSRTALSMIRCFGDWVSTTGRLQWHREETVERDIG